MRLSDTPPLNVMQVAVRETQLLVLVLLCHFLSAVTVLGMPLFLPRILASIDPQLADYWVGILFVTPGICTALAAAKWGHFADKYGKRTSLLRAQLGLSFGFIISGFANSVEVFTLGLIIQGLFGGTLAASNAYLSGIKKGDKLAQSLNFTQISARLALLLGPILLGLFTNIAEPLIIYRYLALLPLLAFSITWIFPTENTLKKKSSTANKKVHWNKGLTVIIALQFLFSFSMVVTFPYFLKFANGFGVNNDSVIGLFYSLPHLAYLLLVFFIPKLPWSSRCQVTLGLLALAVTCIGHSLAVSIVSLLFLRLLFGVAMVLTYNGIHRLLSEHLIADSAGFIFGRFDASGKWAGVAGGLVAGLMITLAPPVAPFIAAAASSLMGALLLTKLGTTKDTNRGAKK